MAIQAEKAKFELAPEGTFGAVCVAVVDLGTQSVKFGDKPAYDQHKVYLCWELVGENDSRGEPFLIAADYSLSMSAKSKLRPLIDGLFGSVAAKAENFDVTKFKGQACLITIAHITTNSGREAAVVNGLGRPMKGQKIEAPKHKPFVWEMHQPIRSLPDWLPFLYGQKVQDVIEQSREQQEGATAGSDEGEVADDAAASQDPF